MLDEASPQPSLSLPLKDNEVVILGDGNGFEGQADMLSELYDLNVFCGRPDLTAGRAKRQLSKNNKDAYEWK